MLTTVSFSNSSAVTMLPIVSNESAISILSTGSAMLSTSAMRIKQNITFFNATPNPQLEYERTVYMWLVPIMVFVLTIAFIGNGVIVLSAPWLNRPINPYHRLCVSLAAADMWVAVLLTTGLIVNSYLPVVLKVPKTKKDICVAAFLEIFRISGMLTSNLHIFALAVHQYVGIVYPLRYKMIITTRRQRCLILVMWMLPLIFTLTWFVAIPNDGFRGSICRMNFYFYLPFRLNVFISFIVPFFGTFALYGTLLITFMRTKAKCQNDLRRSMHENYRRRLKSNLKLVWTTLLILSTFTLSWGLCVLYFVLVCIDGCVFSYKRNTSFLLLGSSVNFLVALKLVLNPLIYALRMRHIRKSVISCLGSVRFTCSKRLGLTSGNSTDRTDNDFARRINSACEIPSDASSRYEKLMRLRKSNQLPDVEYSSSTENVQLLNKRPVNHPRTVNHRPSVSWAKPVDDHRKNIQL